MGLESFNSDSSDIADNKCPQCETEGKHFMNNEYICTNNSCDVVSWYNVSFELDFDVPDIW